MNKIVYNNITLGYLGNIEDAPPGLKFYGSASENIQVATFRYENGHIMNAHRHIPRQSPNIIVTHEILLVWNGRLKLKIFDIDNIFRERYYMTTGDFYININGGVEYIILQDDTILLEVKTGPYPGDGLDAIKL